MISWNVIANVIDHFAAIFSNSLRWDVPFQNALCATICPATLWVAIAIVLVISHWKSPSPGTLEALSHHNLSHPATHHDLKLRTTFAANSIPFLIPTLPLEYLELSIKRLHPCGLPERERSMLFQGYSKECLRLSWTRYECKEPHVTEVLWMEGVLLWADHIEAIHSHSHPTVYKTVRAVWEKKFNGWNFGGWKINVCKMKGFIVHPIVWEHLCGIL